ncbi:uncharacterized protein A1O5_02068 [Cladophialophora psammophila CBS 110553]|uniref:Zn(2)-C6 fungal-type domain-containing protein n=1 Tax=Cladophialophora psammophila CBS 110553 TaxID=1182543 RepID=W9X4G7_9EURO|nr:uncharacterized protein A1O5_02068 [Cladophialophora psammophila CBS 110553]EXJ75372.1 hypothetical protein A1O5_02068 [Cladophialophora psammophila CBS 110553]
MASHGTASEDSPSLPLQSHSRKRGASAAGLGPKGRAARRRASKACYSCRTRKVRCDVVERGVPCTNCRLDGVECVLTSSRRGKATTATVEEPSHIHSPQSFSDHADDLPVGLTFENRFNRSSQAEPSNRLSDPGTDCVISGVKDTDASVPYQSRDIETHQPNDFGQMSEASRPALSAPLINPLQNDDCFIPPGLQQEQAYGLPHYVHPLPPCIDAHGAQFLAHKGALTVPDASLRNELLRSYVQYVHPFMPILDLRQFLTPIARNDGSGQISLLTLQAVMFAGSTFVDLRFLQNHGYNDRREARKAFYTWARMLYDFDYESDDSAVLQAVLLLTYWYESPEDRKHTWYWMGISVSVAYTMGLNRRQAHSNRDHKTQRLFKRLWWACHIRDRLIALGMRRPAWIKLEDHDTPMLERDDFDTEPLPNELFTLLGGAPSVLDCVSRPDLVYTCIDLAKLTVCIGHILVTQYSLVNTSGGGTAGGSMMLSPQRSTLQMSEATRCEEQLRKWEQELHPEARYTVVGAYHYGGPPVDPVINVHRALLQMVYLTTLSALYRPQVFRPKQLQKGRPSKSEISARQTLRHAANEITDIISDLQAQDQIRFLSTSGVMVLSPTVITLLLDVKSPDHDKQSASIARFYRCMQVLHKLRENYASADSAISFLEAAIQKAHVHIPSGKADFPPLSHESSNGGIRASDNRTLLATAGSLNAMSATQNCLTATLATVDKDHSPVYGQTDQMEGPSNDALTMTLHDPMGGVASIGDDMQESNQFCSLGEGENNSDKDDNWYLVDALFNFEGNNSLHGFDGGFGTGFDIS